MFNTASFLSSHPQTNVHDALNPRHGPNRGHSSFLGSALDHNVVVERPSSDDIKNISTTNCIHASSSANSTPLLVRQYVLDKANVVAQPLASRECTYNQLVVNMSEETITCVDVANPVTLTNFDKHLLEAVPWASTCAVNRAWRRL